MALESGERGRSRGAVTQALGDGVGGEVSHAAGTRAQVVAPALGLDHEERLRGYR